MALSLDRSLDTIYAANSRLRKLLEEQDGYHWKDKLPQHPEHDSITGALSQRSFTDTNPNTTDTSDRTGATDTHEGVDGADSTPSSSTAPAPPPTVTTSTASTAVNLSTNVSPL